MNPKWGLTPFQLPIDLLRHPHSGWLAIAAIPHSAGTLLTRLVVPGALASALASTLGVALLNREWSADFGYDAPAAQAVPIGLVLLFGSVGYTCLLAWVFARMGALYGSRRAFTPALTVAAYGALPVWISGAFLFFMPAILLSMIAFVYTCLLYSNGAAAVLGVKEREAPEFVAVSLLLAALITTVAGIAFAALTKL